MSNSELQEIGMTEKEAEVYLALLRLGSSSASAIIQKTGLHRAVVYDLLERLIEKGLASYATVGRKKFFEAANPNRLIEILKEKEQKIQNVLPSLLELSKFQSTLEVKIFKGKQGIKSVLEDIIRSKPKEWLSLSSGGETYKTIPYFLEQFHKERIKLKIKVRGLLTNNSTAKKRGKALSAMPFTKIKYLPKTIQTPTVINIYGNSINFYCVTKNEIPFIILIESKELADSFKKYFEWLWRISK